MIRSLTGTGSTAAEADVLVIGAGTAGLTVAATLARDGFRVICVESGAHAQLEEEHPLNEVVHARAVYAGAAHGRFRALGGTSTRWGGALIPFQQADLAGHDWPVEYEEILAERDAVERFFGLPSGPYELPDRPIGHDYVPRLAKWPSFSRRNVANLVPADLLEGEGMQVWLDATATGFVVANDLLASVTAQAVDGSTLTICARQVVIAAGAIETTRLLLLLDRQNGGAVFAKDDQLGRYFHDHLSVVVADLAVADRATLNRLVGFRFDARGSMRNLRFELAPDSRLRGAVAPCFAHVGFETSGGGFDALRELFRHVQQRRPPPFAVLLRLAAATPWLIRAAWWRFVHRRLLYPGDARLQLHMVVEQQPDADCRIRLSSDRVDRFGNPLAEIDWSPGTADVANLTRAVDALDAAWSASPLARVARLVRRPAGEAEGELATGGGIYHPGGSTRMAASARDGVVDADLVAFRCRNLTVLATSVLPNGGGANPTMMLLMLAFRAARRLASTLG